MEILFIDPVCPKPYTPDSPMQGRMGGTEATAARVVEALVARGFNVSMEQRGLEAESFWKTLHLYPLGKYDKTPDVVITLRDGVVYREAMKKYPKAKHYIWLHDVVSGEYQKHLEDCLWPEMHNVLVVSQWHKNQVYNALPKNTMNGCLRVQVVYNPVADYISQISYKGPIDPYKLVYLSSPHKGLDQVLAHFKELQKRSQGGYKLYVANPGYYPDMEGLPEGVISLTDRNYSHPELMDFCKDALCLFYPQNYFEETFGIVYAEANALGLPVITHDIGAAREVLSNQSQVVNCNKLKYVADTIDSWAGGLRPIVNLNPLFSQAEVTKTWVKLIKFGNTGYA